MKRGLIERLADGPMLGDGGYLLELERRGWVQAGPFTPEVSISHPEALVELHREFAHAGAEWLEALGASQDHAREGRSSSARRPMPRSSRRAAPSTLAVRSPFDRCRVDRPRCSTSAAISGSGAGSPSPARYRSSIRSRRPAPAAAGRRRRLRGVSVGGDARRRLGRRDRSAGHTHPGAPAHAAASRRRRRGSASTPDTTAAGRLTSTRRTR